MSRAAVWWLCVLGSVAVWAGAVYGVHAALVAWWW